MKNFIKRMYTNGTPVHDRNEEIAEREEETDVAFCSSKDCKGPGKLKPFEINLT